MPGGAHNMAVRGLYGLRYARLSDPGNPRSAAVAATAAGLARDLAAVPVFPQLPSRLERVMGPGIRDNPQSDDAFFLNIWSRAGARGLPVLVFLHGGAWVSGGGAARWYRGARLASEGMVVVTLNYRLRPAGHMEDGQGEAHRPLGDILTALACVRDHIADHGGDPGRVTLAGQSAGAWYAWALSMLPAARGLFTRSALLSPPEITPWTAAGRQAFTSAAETLADRYRIGGESAETALLRAGAETLAARPVLPGAIPAMYLPVWPRPHPVADGALHVAALYIRVTEHEMSVFLPSDIAPQLPQLPTRLPAVPVPAIPPGWSAARAEAIARSSQSVFGAMATAIADAAARQGLQVSRRRFAALSGLADLGAAHCFDLPFQFGNRDDWRDAPMLTGWSGPDFQRLSNLVIDDLAAFVKGETRAPNAVLGMGDGPHHIGGN